MSSKKELLTVFKILMVMSTTTMKQLTEGTLTVVKCLRASTNFMIMQKQWQKTLVPVKIMFQKDKNDNPLFSKIGIPDASLLDLPQLIGSQGIKELSRPEPTFFKFPYTFCQNFYDGVTSVAECMSFWKTFMEKPWNVSHPCELNMDCCHKYASSEIIGKNLTAIMTVMKHAYHRLLSYCTRAVVKIN